MADVGELAGLGVGHMRLRDGDILVVRNNEAVLSKEALVELRLNVERELNRLGVANVGVLPLPRNVHIDTIGRS